MSERDGNTALPFTGERFTPECVREIRYEHWHRYAWAAGLVSGRRVLDCACGEGYGTRLLAERAAFVDGVDIDHDTVAHATQRYAHPRVAFHQASALALPFDDHSHDIVVSFETLEHLAEQDALLAEFRRVLKPDGFLILSTPDKRVYSDLTGYRNEFHVRELYRDEFEALVGAHFPALRLFGQKLMFHSVMWPLAGEVQRVAHLTEVGACKVVRGDRPSMDAVYLVAVAAAAEAHLPETGALSLFCDQAESVYAHYNDEVAKHIRAGQLLAERETEIERLKAQRAPIWTRLLARLKRR
ncbi:MAG: hypothetical protein Kow0020_15580 [Wenzhouxiangellaceae bacterium]